MMALREDFYYYLKGGKNEKSWDTIEGTVVVFQGGFGPPWGRSSAGRASRSQCEGREFDPPRLHQFFPLFLEF